MIIDDEGVNLDGFPYYELISDDKKCEVTIGTYTEVLWPYKVEFEEEIDEYKESESTHKVKKFFETYKISENEYFSGPYGVFEELYPEDSIYPANQELNDEEKRAHMLLIIELSIGLDFKRQVVIEPYKDEDFEGFCGRHLKLPIEVYSEDIIETYFNLIESVEEYQSSLNIEATVD